MHAERERYIYMCMCVCVCVCVYKTTLHVLSTQIKTRVVSAHLEIIARVSAGRLNGGGGRRC